MSLECAKVLLNLSENEHCSEGDLYTIGLGLVNSGELERWETVVGELPDKVREDMKISESKRLFALSVISGYPETFFSSLLREKREARGDMR